MCDQDHEYAASLLDRIALEISCNCLSELRTPRLFPLIAQIVEHIDESAYAQREWEEAIYYITREKCKSGTCGKDDLIHCLMLPR